MKFFEWMIDEGTKGLIVINNFFVNIFNSLKKKAIFRNFIFIFPTLFLMLFIF
jgi:hypothetical protein